MFGIIRYFKDKKQKRIDAENRKLHEEEERKRIEKQILVSYHEKLLERIEEKRTKANKDEQDRSDKRNQTCPKCRKSSVIDNIKQIQGELHGSGSGRGYGGGSFLFTRYSSSSSMSIDGSIDTHPVNRCKECGHEWKKSTPDYKWASDAVEDNVTNPWWLCSRLLDCENTEFDPDSILEQYPTRDIKVSQLKAEILNGMYLTRVNNIWKDMPIELWWILFKKHKENYMERISKETLFKILLTYTQMKKLDDLKKQET